MNNSNVFQSFFFYDFNNNIPNQSAKYYSIKENDKIVISCLVTIQKEKGIKSFFSKRAIIFGGPISDSLNEKLIEQILNEIYNDLKNKVIFIEFRNFVDLNSYKKVFIQNGYTYVPYLNYLINIQNLNDSFLNFKSEKRRQINKAIKEGVDFREVESKEEVIDLYNILKKLYKTKVKKPLPSLDYFLKLYEKMIEYNSGFVCIVTFNDKIIGGAICPTDNHTIYDWFRCGLDSEYKKLYPSTVAVYAGMKIAHQKGKIKYDFMGAGIKNIPYGVRDFKSQFSGELVEYGRFIKVTKPLLYKLGKFALEFIQKIKK